jgi:imidazolonepropionase-like amidohydrolase
MMRRLFPHAFILLAAAITAAAPARTQAVSHVDAIHSVHVVDVEEGNVFHNQTVLIANGRISHIGPAPAVQIPFGAKAIDGRGRFLIPGLIDTHAHLWWDGERLDEEPLRRFLRNGTTTIRHAGRGGQAAAALRAREDAAKGALQSPRLVVSGMVDSRSVTRHGVPTPGALAERLVKLGVDGLKIRHGLSDEDVREIICTGRHAGIPVYGHTNDNGLSGRDYSLLAVEQGISGIMHVPDLISRPGGAPGDPQDWQAQWLWWRSIWASMPQPEQERLIKAMLRQNVWLEPTLITEHWIAYEAEHLTAAQRRGLTAEVLAARRGFPTYSGSDLDLYRQTYRNIESFVRTFAEAGGTVLAGTDCVPTCGFVQDELRLLVRAGLSPHRALRAATIDAAQALGRDDVGQVRIGSRADLVLLRGNPLEDIGETENIAIVLLGGVPVDEAAERIESEPLLQ